MPGASEAKLRIGQRIAGYELESIVGKGGMGVVYRAQHVQLRRRAAIKILPAELAASDDFRHRFIRESRAAASITHPNIVTVYDAGEFDGLLYIAMQLVEGSDLSTILAEERVLPVERMAWILGQVASALDAAHERGLIHRDVKPANILVDDHAAYLADFGLTKRMAVAGPTSAATAADKFVGTVDYVAPEQITSGDIDARTDVYALGCVLYESLSGAVPFWRPQPIETLYAHIHEPVPRLGDRRPDLPAALGEVVATAMAKRKEDRYESAGALADDVRRALANEPVLVPADSQPAKVSRPSRLSGRRVVAIAVAVAAVAAGAVVLASAGGDEERAGPPETRPTPTTESETVPKPKPGPVATTVARVGRRPFGILPLSREVWVTAFDSNWLRRLDPRTGGILGERIPVGDGPIAITRGSGLLWVANTHADTVQRVDPATSDPYGPAIPVGNLPSGIAATRGSVWVVAERDDLVTRINGATGTVAGTTKVGDLPRGIAATPSLIWIANRRDGTVTRVSTDTGAAVGRPIRVGRDPHSLAVGGGFVWVANNDDDTVTRIRRSSGRPVQPPIRVGRAPWGIAYGLGFVWVTNSADNTVTRIRASSGRVIGKPIAVGREPTGIAVGSGAVWVANNDSGTVSRIAP